MFRLAWIKPVLDNRTRNRSITAPSASLGTRLGTGAALITGTPPTITVWIGSHYTATYDLSSQDCHSEGQFLGPRNLLLWFMQRLRADPSHLLGMTASGVGREKRRSPVNPNPFGFLGILGTIV